MDFTRLGYFPIIYVMLFCLLVLFGLTIMFVVLAEALI